MVHLRAQALAMLHKVRDAHPVRAGMFDLKYSAGGMVEIEFATQVLVLGHGASQPALHDNVGTIALLQRAEVVGLLGPGVGHAAADAYRELRRLQHRARLDEQSTQVDPLPLAELREAVHRLSGQVFG
jgi:[glutamine synthetase] adenylyltransferase / [glutamine synthetase]-adenylyl-L-tyrosine phosphorylase